MARRKRSASLLAGKPDPLLLGICLTLAFTGILILASVSASFSLQRTGSTFFYLNHQLLFGLLPGAVFGFIAFLTPLETLKKYSFHLLAASIVLLSMVFLPIVGGELGGAQRWIFVGSLSFQPSEILKVAFILYAGSWLAARSGEARGRKKAAEELATMLLPFLLVGGLVSAILLLQPDLSTLLVIGATALVMYFVAGTPLWHTFFMVGAGAAAIAALVLAAPYRLNRILVLFDSSLDPLGKGYQIKQALIGIGSGGILGAGVSFQKFGFLPEPMSDSVFAVFAEEMGFVGAVFLVSLFLLFAWRGFWVARRGADAFSRLVAVGITFWITLQAFVHMGALTGILPLTGIPLPFISYGGSSMIAELIGIGILLNISKQTV